ncbi:linear amide C-N hydrolase [Yersinia alsatica]|uniref:linear amide C-N hydrolase n=1 Tax=Yersinia alsatica TaxID=2890317 RepID=UPI0011AB00A3|nr:linear amide C-N hydrolase [Yersinia alsatica]
MKKPLLAITLTIPLLYGVAQACTVAAYTNGDVALSMRTMDWYGNDEGIVIGSGQGIVNTYSKNTGFTAKAKYASLKIKSFAPGLVAAALNEKGLEGHMLYLSTDSGTEFQQSGKGKKNVDAANLIRFAIDNFASVPEVIEALQSINVIGTKICNIPGHINECIYPPVHYMYSDAQGNTAVVEYIKGNLVVHTGPGSNVMSNDPKFEYHLSQDVDKVEPNGTIRAADRRLRAKQVIDDMYKRNVTNLTEAKISLKAAGATVFSGLNQLDPYVNQIYPTLWTSYMDRHNGTLTLERHDTWAAEQYNFSMFNKALAQEIKLGSHPFYKSN